MTIEKFGYKQELKKTLSTWDLIIYGMIFMVPIAPFGVFGYIYESSHGMVASVYMIGAIAMFFTAMSYWSMSRILPIAGSVYTYARYGIHEMAGFLAGWLILLDYILVPSLLYIVSAAALHSIIPGVPDWLWLIIFIATNTFINIIGIEFTMKANRYILIAELIVLIAFFILGLSALHGHATTGSTNQLTLKPFYDGNVFNPNIIIGSVSIAVLSFLGFDGISSLAEECKDGPNSIGKASILSLLVIGVLFIIQTWIASDLIRNIKFSDPDTAFYVAANIAGGAKLKLATILATAFSWGIANALVAQATTARVLFAMGRDRKLPHILAKIHPRFKTPYISTLIVAVISLVIGVIAIGHIDDLSRLVNFGALTGFMLLHLSVINHYVVRQKSKQWVVHLLFPVIGLIIIGYVLFEMDHKAIWLGLGWLIVGIIYYLIKDRVSKL